MKILLIEDDQDTASFLRERLREKGYAVEVARDGDQGIHSAQTRDHDLILLDYGLPGKDGLSVCKEIRTDHKKRNRHIPIIMISATTEVSMIVKGLNRGVDDYVTKPFFFDELLARIQAVLRRPSFVETSKYRLDDLVIDTTRQKVTRGSESIYLTKKEFSLLEYLMKNKGVVVSRGELTEHVWDRNLDSFSNSIDMHIFNLRKKISIPKKPELIHSYPGRGYKADLER